MLQGTENIVRVTGRSLEFLSLLNGLADDNTKGDKQGDER